MGKGTLDRLREGVVGFAEHETGLWDWELDPDDDNVDLPFGHGGR